jgi:biotin carboxyl carrier protein
VALIARGVRVSIGDQTRDVEEGSEPGDIRMAGPGAAFLTPPDGRPRRVLWSHAGERLEIVVDGWRFEVDVEDLERARLRERARRAGSTGATHAPLVLRAPIPGRISSVRVVEGEAVESGAPLVTLEAMKMENVVRAPRAGTIGRVAVGADQTVELGDTLLELA